MIDAEFLESCRERYLAGGIDGDGFGRILGDFVREKAEDFYLFGFGGGETEAFLARLLPRLRGDAETPGRQGGLSFSRRAALFLRWNARREMREAGRKGPPVWTEWAGAPAEGAEDRAAAEKKGECAEKSPAPGAGLHGGGRRKDGCALASCPFVAGILRRARGRPARRNTGPRP